MKRTSCITQKDLINTLHYDSETGVFTWLKPSNFRIKKHSVAGGVNRNGYIRIRINKIDYLAHRLAWLYMTGEMPINDIDHINGIVIDNRLCNLRQATASENLKNARIRNDNKSGEKGVCFDINRKKWMASASLNGKNKFLGRFDNLQDASDAYQSFAKLHHGDFYYAKSRGSNNA